MQIYILPDNALWSLSRMKMYILKKQNDFHYTKHIITVYISLTDLIPAFTTAWVWADVPEAMFVKAHAASNCKEGLKIETDTQKYRYITESDTKIYKLV